MNQGNFEGSRGEMVAYFYSEGTASCLHNDSLGVSQSGPSPAPGSALEKGRGRSAPSWPILRLGKPGSPHIPLGQPTNRRNRHHDFGAGPQASERGLQVTIKGRQSETLRSLGKPSC
jgi:hypothetical protein